MTLFQVGGGGSDSIGKFLLTLFLLAENMQTEDTEDERELNGKNRVD